MNHSEFYKKYDLLPSNASWMLKAMNPYKNECLLSVVSINKTNVPGIIVVFKTPAEEPGHVYNDYNFFKMEPYFDSANSIIDFDIIDRPYTVDEFEMLDDYSFELFNDIVMNILKDKDPDAYEILLRKEEN